MAEVSVDRAIRHDDRRHPAPRPLPGGSRASDPPLTTRACADWMGVTPSWIRSAITEGVPVDGRLVTLETEIVPGKRLVYRIHLDRFIAFLRAIKWRRIPPNPRDRRPPDA